MNNDFQESIKYGRVQLKPNLTTTRYHTTRNGYTTKVVVVGCGGTGSRLIPLLAQAISVHNNLLRTSNIYRDKAYLKHEIGLTLVDGDDGISAKNLIRQNFYQFDIGQPKAKAMALRYSALYGMNIEYFDSFYQKSGLFKANTDHIANCIYFDCTDNKQARQSIETNLIAENNVIISCGNESDFGQVMYSFKQSKQHNRSDCLIESIKSINNLIKAENFSTTVTIKAFPTLLELFRDFKDTQTNSCVDMVLQNEQSMPINNLVATLAYNMYYDIVSGKALNYNMVKCNINNTFTTNFISNPKTCLNILYKGFYGIEDPRCNDAFTEFNKFLNDYYSYRKLDEVNALIDKYDVLSVPHIRGWITKNYYLGNNDKIALNDKIKGYEDKLNEFFGIKVGGEEDAGSEL